MSDTSWVYKEIKCILLVAEFFNYDLEKTTTWFETMNPLLGNLLPSMFLASNVDKLLSFIQTQLDENPPKKKGADERPPHSQQKTLP